MSQNQSPNLTDLTFLELLKNSRKYAINKNPNLEGYTTRESMILEHIRTVTKRKRPKLTEDNVLLYQRIASSWNLCFWRLYDKKLVTAFGQGAVKITAAGRKYLKESTSGRKKGVCS